MPRLSSTCSGRARARRRVRPSANPIGSMPQWPANGMSAPRCPSRLLRSGDGLASRAGPLHGSGNNPRQPGKGTHGQPAHIAWLSAPSSPRSPLPAPRRPRTTRSSPSRWSCRGRPAARPTSPCARLRRPPPSTWASRSSSTTSRAPRARSAPPSMAADAKPDGYTLAQMPITVIRLPLMQKTAWDRAEGLHLHRAPDRLHLRRHRPRRDGQFKSWPEVVALRQGQSGQGHLRDARRRHVAAHRHGADRRQCRHPATHVPFKGGAETNAAVLGGHTTLQADFDRLEAAGRRRPAPPAGDLDGRAQQELARRADAQGAGLSLRVRIRRSASPGPRAWTRRGAKLHDAFKKAIEDKAGDRDDGQVRHGAPDYMNTEDYRKPQSQRDRVESKRNGAAERARARQEKRRGPSQCTA